MPAWAAAVTVIEAMEIPLSNVLGPMIGAHCGSLHAAHGVDLRTGVGVAGVRRAEGASSGLVVELEGGEVLEADVVVVGIGVVPAVGWLEDSGLTLENGVVCDDRLFAADGIVAAGDMARWMWRHDGAEELIRIEHWQVAAEAGVAAARSVLAGRASPPQPFAPIPYFWSDQFGIRFQVLGNPGGTDDVEIVDGSFEEGKFVALFGRAGRLRAAMAIGRPRRLMGYRPSARGRQQLGRRIGTRGLVAPLRVLPPSLLEGDARELGDGGLGLGACRQPALAVRDRVASSVRGSIDRRGRERLGDVVCPIA